MRSARIDFSSRTDTSSGQNSWSVPWTKVRRREISMAGVNRITALYPGFDMIRTTPFSVIGQLAHPVFSFASHQA